MKIRSYVVKNVQQLSETAVPTPNVRVVGSLEECIKTEQKPEINKTNMVGACCFVTTIISTVLRHTSWSFPFKFQRIKNNCTPAHNSRNT
jgi:hypothetical protein